MGLQGCHESALEEEKRFSGLARAGGRALI